MQAWRSVADRPAGRLRVLYVVQGILPTGPGRHLYKLLAYRNRETVDAQVFAFDRCDPDMMAVLQRDHGIQWEAIGLRFTEPRAYWRGMPRLLARVDAFRPHVIQTHHTPMVDWAARLATRLRRVPLNLSRAVGQPRQYHLSRQGRLAWWFTRFGDWSTSRMVDYYLPNSQDVAAYMRDVEHVPPDRIITIPNGVDTELFRPSAELRADGRRMLHLPESCRLIAYVAALKSQKEQHLLVEAVLALLPEFPDLRVAMVGRTWGSGDDLYLKGIQDRIAGSGYGDRFLFTGELPDVRPVLAAADVYAHPSAYEGSSNAVLEAMSMGLACVVSDVSGSPELVANGAAGIVVPQRDGPALTAALGQLLRDQVVRDRLGAAARARAEDGYSAYRMCRDVEAVARRGLAGKGVVV